MGSIPLGANNFFQTEKCVCHLCGTTKTFYFILLQIFGYVAHYYYQKCVCQDCGFVKSVAKCSSPTGNRTRAFHVTGGDPYH